MPGADLSRTKGDVGDVRDLRVEPPVAAENLGQAGVARYEVLDLSDAHAVNPALDDVPGRRDVGLILFGSRERGFHER